MRGNGHILIVEDEPVNAMKIEHQLTKLGYSIAGVTGSGEEAIALVEKDRPDLVLMDIGLEGVLDGVEAANIIRRRFQVPVIYLTTNSDESTIDRARSSEAHGYLHKPIQAPALHSALQMALSKAAMESSILDERKWLATTLRCIRDGVIAADSIGTIKLMNAAAEQLTGWSQSDAVGRDLSEVFRVLEPDTRAMSACAIMSAMTASPEGTCYRRILISRDGSETPIEETAGAIVDAGGLITGIVLVFHQT